MRKIFLEHMMQIAQKGGKIALDLLEDSAPTLKPDFSVLTEADLAISALTRRELRELLTSSQHILIDEEDKEHKRYFDKQVLESAPYIWVLDPIDGTRSFANRLPMFGISIGLLKEMKPWLGLVYFPLLKELFYCDGKYGYFVKNAFTKKAEKIRIKPVDLEITRQSIFYTTDSYFKYFEWDFTFCTAMMLSCAVTDLCWPSIGRGCGNIFRSNFWDFAGSWPIFRSAGLELRHLETGKPLDFLNLDAFVGQGEQTWKLKDYHVLSSERNFSIIKNRLKLKPKA